jgi:WD40 repeat protein
MQLVKDLTPIGYENENLKCFDVSDDGKYLAALNEGKAYIKVWDLETYELIKNKQLYDNNLSNPNDYRCEAQDIEFSSIDNDLIYYSGDFPAEDKTESPNGIYKLSILNDLIEDIEPNEQYSEGKFLLFDLENRLMVYNYGVLIVINYENKDIEFYRDMTLEFPFGTKTLYSSLSKYFIGFSNQYIGTIIYDSQTRIENIIEEEIIISPNPTNKFVDINLNCPEPLINYNIRDISGLLLIQSTIENQVNSLQFDFTPYPSGVYFLTINCNNHTKTYKVIKEN